MKHNQKQAFTLIELIVVITILAILWTIAFIALQWYSAQARDSKRVSDISNIKKSLELFSLSTWKFPKPDDYNTVSYYWELIWYQWKVWDQVTKNLSRNLNEKPVDPLTQEEYTYSTINAQTEYELLALYESDLISWVQVLEESYAKIRDFAKIEGNYNWLYARTSSFYIPTPSIINWNVWWNVDFADDESLIESQVVTWWDNIPLTSTWGLNIKFSPYEWTITRESTEEEKMQLVEAIQTAYSGSQLANDTTYADVLSRTSTWGLVEFVDVVVLEVAEFSTFSNGGWYSSWEGENNEWWELLNDWNIAEVCEWADRWTLIYESTNSDDPTWLTCEHDIAVCSWDGIWYIIQACNIWATTTDLLNAGSRWKYFQWWRNKPFYPSPSILESNPIENEDYNPNNDEYWFISWENSPRYDWLVTQDDNLWWYYEWTWTDEQRQWPCPTWYHVPSSLEWLWLVQAWSSLWPYSAWNTWDFFRARLRLPKSGLLSRLSWNSWWVNGYGFYWTSDADWDEAGHLRYGYNEISVGGSSDLRAFGQSIRCFQN